MDKVASDELRGYCSNYARQVITAGESLYNQGLDKKASQLVDQMNTREKILFKQAEALGRGIAIGQKMAEQTLTDNIANSIINTINEKLGEDAAETVREAIYGDNINLTKQAEEDNEELSKLARDAMEVAIDGITPVVIEAYGGEEKLKAAMEKDASLADVVVYNINKLAESSLVELVNMTAMEPEGKEE